MLDTSCVEGWAASTQVFVTSRHHPTSPQRHDTLILPTLRPGVHPAVCSHLIRLFNRFCITYQSSTRTINLCVRPASLAEGLRHNMLLSKGRILSSALNL